MKKYLLLTGIFSILFIYAGIAQSINVLNGPFEVRGNINDEELVANAIIKNMTQNPLDFKMKLDILEITDGHAVAICWGICLPPVTESFETPDIYTLGPEQSSTHGQFSVHCYPYKLISDNPPVYTLPVKGKTKVRITFYKVGNPNDFYEYDITFVVQDPSSVEDDNISDLNISDIYPNPAKDNAKIEFSYPKDQEKPHLEIYDLSGNLIINRDLCDCENFVYVDTSKLSAGSYYMQLISSGKKSKSKTLLIQK